MLHEIRLGREFFASLLAIDEEIAREVAAGGCPRCGGPLHRADYERKPRGGLLAAAGETFSLRHSLCCGREGCRARALPPSLRFLGRRVYVEAVVLLASIVALVAPTPRAARAATGVPWRTLCRWGIWWREAFVTTQTWVLLRARFSPPPPDEKELPKSLFDRLASSLGRIPDAISAVEVMCASAAQRLAPATTSSVPEPARFVRDHIGAPRAGFGHAEDGDLAGI